MTQRALAISKDIVNELKRLAVLASKDDSFFDEARLQYERAGQMLVSSSSKLAVALYDFTLRYADQENLVEAKLTEHGVQFKRTSSVYVKIARLAFDDVKDEKGEVSRTRVSRYASIIQSAHAKGYTAAQFKKSVENGVTQALRKFSSADRAVSNDAVALGRELASSLAGKLTFQIDQFPLPENAAEGDDVELLARVEGGKLVVYGILPQNVSNVRGVLSRLGAREVTEALHAAQLLPELQRAIKLVSGKKDGSCKASYAAQVDQVRFSVFGPSASAVLVAPIEMNIFAGTGQVLKLDDWVRILETLAPLRKHITAVSSNANDLLVQLDEHQVPELTKWIEQNKKVIRIGKAVGSTLQILLEQQELGEDGFAGLTWDTAAVYSSDEIKPLLDFRLSKKLVSFRPQAGAVLPVASEKAQKDHINLGRKALSSTQAAIRKMLRLSHVIAVERADTHVRFSCTYGKGLQLSFVIGMA